MNVGKTKKCQASNALSFINIELRKIYSGSIIAFSGEILSAASQYLLIIVLGRLLGPAEVGLFFLGRAIMRLASIGGTLGFSESLLKFIPGHLTQKKNNEIRKTIHFAFLSTFLISTVLAVFLYLASGALSTRLFKDEELIAVIRGFTICLPLFSILTMMFSSIRAFREMLKLIILSKIVYPGGVLVFAIIYLYYTKTVLSVIFAVLTALIVSIALGLVFLKKILPPKNHIEFHAFSGLRMYRESIPFIGTGIVGFFLYWMDSFMLGILDNSEAVGIYSGATRIALFSTIILSSINSVFAPTISKMYALKNFTGLERTYKTTVRWIIHISIPIYLFIFLFSSQIMGLYGSAFRQGNIALIILSLGQFLNISVGSAGYLLNMTGKQQSEFVNQVITLAMNFCLNWYLIPIMSITGAATATSISILTVNLLRVFENYKHLHIHPFSMKIINPFLRTRIEAVEDNKTK